MATKNPEMQEQGSPAAPGKKQKLEVPKNQFGEEPERDLEKFPEGSPARSGETTPPSGQGGASPHDGISHQDQWPPNPEPSESAKEKGEENDRIARGEVSEVGLANERLDEVKQAKTKDKK